MTKRDNPSTPKKKQQTSIDTFATGNKRQNCLATLNRDTQEGKK